MKATALIAIVGVVAVLGVAGTALASGTVANALGSATDGDASGHVNGVFKHSCKWSYAGESDGCHNWNYSWDYNYDYGDCSNCTPKHDSANCPCGY